MRKLILFLLVNTGFFALAQNPSIEGELQSRLQDAVEEEKVIGISSGVISNDTVIMTLSEGYANLESKVPFSDQTINRTASITKPITAIAIFQLVEKGKLSLADKVSKYLPEFNEPRLENISIKHVLQHSSGIGHYKNKKEASNEQEYSTLEDALRIFIDRELLFEPGTDFQYTSYGYVVLGLVIESASGLSYEDYLKKNIFDMANMPNTSIERQAKTPQGKSKIYHQIKPGKIREIENSNLSDRLPGGGVQSTVRDLLNFGKAVLNNDLISQESFELMIESSGLKKEGNAYGMGWYLYGDNPDFGNIVGHSGGQYGCSSFLFILPDYNAATVALANTSGFEEIANISLSMIKLTKQANKQ